MRHRPTITIATPQIVAHAKFNNAPHLHGRNIFRPYVRQQYPFTQPSNIDMPQIVAHTRCNHAPHVYGRNIFRPSVRHQSTITQPSNVAAPQIVAPATRRRITDVGAKYFSPVRAALMRNYPHVVIAHPPPAAAPRMYGRNIFRPFVRQRFPVTQPSNIAAPQIVAPAQCNHAPHLYGRNIFRPYVRD